MITAAASCTDAGAVAVAKMDWVLEKGRGGGITADTSGAWLRLPPQAILAGCGGCGTAACSGVPRQCCWRHCSTPTWPACGVLQKGGRRKKAGPEATRFLPPATSDEWRSLEVVCTAAGSPRDSPAELRWLEERGAVLGSLEAVQAATKQGNVEAVQLLLQAGGPLSVRARGSRYSLRAVAAAV